MDVRHLTRRSFFAGGATLTATCVAAPALLAPHAASARPEPIEAAAPAILRGDAAFDSVRTVRLVRRSTGEQYRGVYCIDGVYVPEAMEMLDWTLRDTRIDKARAIDPRLIDVLSRLQSAFDLDELIVTSGYRSRKTNEWIRRRTGMAARNSFHIEGMAADVYSPNVSARRLARKAGDCGAGGIGYYPSHGFIHLDVGPYRRWRA